MFFGLIFFSPGFMSSSVVYRFLPPYLNLVTSLRNSTILTSKAMTETAPRSFPLERFYNYMFLPGLILLLVPGILQSYLLMPFPGSQDLNSIDVVYALHSWVVPLRIIGLLLIIGPIIKGFLTGAMLRRVSIVMFCVFCFVVFYYTTFAASASNIFREPSLLRMAAAADNRVSLDDIIIGIEHNGVAKAYPVNYLAHHYRISDSIGSLKLWVTYCSMCRTGAIYQPIIDNQQLTFRLIGANHYNAVFEDEATGSWWYQATGEAAIGPMKGRHLPVVPSEQMTLRLWLEQYPNSLIAQPDGAQESRDGYARAGDFGRVQPIAENWTHYTWVVGIASQTASKAYLWKSLVTARVVNDTVGKLPVVIVVASDSASFTAWQRVVDGQQLTFEFDSSQTLLTDVQTNSIWNWKGECVEGTYTGQKLQPVGARQQYWHAWQTFHPQTKKWEK